MTEYTIGDVKEADRLYDQLSLDELAEETGIPRDTLGGWSQRGWISTDTNHQSRRQLTVSLETIERADALYDKMPPAKIAKVIDEPLSKVNYWRDQGWISTDIDWRAKNGGRKQKADPRQAVKLVHDKGMKKKDAAKELGVSPPTITRYLKQYRNGNL